MSRLVAVAAAALFLGTSAVADDVEVDVCDDGQPPATWYLDGDGDGYGDRSYAIVACEAPAGFVDNGADQHDGNPDILDR